jgi:MarR family transcriptional regulator, organic hydroperoxide resistance regulator
VYNICIRNSCVETFWTLMYRLTNSFPYLVNRVGVRIGEMFGRRLAPYGVTLPMYRVLAALWERSAQRLSDLSEMTSIEVSTLSRLVGTLTRKGLVSRTRLEDNGRTVSINLTNRGRALADELIPLATHFEEVAIHSFGVDEVAKLKSALATIYEHLNELEPEVTRALDAVPPKPLREHAAVGPTRSRGGRTRVKALREA